MKRGAAWLAAVAVVAAACLQSRNDAVRLPQGDPAAGRVAVVEYGCIACHRIPGAEGPQGQVGPPLGDIGERRVIAGELPNNPENLIAWILDPDGIDEDTLMPDVGVTPDDAADIAAYLYSLD